MRRELYYGDNLSVLRESIPDESVDLVYLDPPFNSQADYNVFFHDHVGEQSGAQILAFGDSWEWNEASRDALAAIKPWNERLYHHLENIVGGLGHGNSLSAYLVMMSIRLLHMHRVLKPSGSLYLHCDPTASHYLKTVLDFIFGMENFRTEVVWKGADAHNDAKKQYAGVTDRILFYSKDYRRHYFRPQHGPFSEKTLREWYLGLEFPDGSTRRMSKEEIESQIIPPNARRFNSGDLRSPSPRPNLIYEYKGFQPHKNGWAVSREKMEELDIQGRLIFPKEPTGRIMRKRYLDEAKGPVLTDLWTDVSQIRGHDVERLGYPTQKPVALLKRIVEASCPENGVVLDPFCGCGTSICAAESLNRQWVGIDITYLSIGLIQLRLERDFRLKAKDYTTIGSPVNAAEARNLAETDPYGFQFWVNARLEARSPGAVSDGRKGKKGADTGIDGLLYFRTPDALEIEKTVISVKAGKKPGPTTLRDLRGTVEREKAAIGVLVVAHPPTKKMLEEAHAAGDYHWNGRRFPRLQILTAEQLIAGEGVKLPTGSVNVTFEQKVARSLTGKRAKDRGAAPLFASD